jgi:hypothetical protein
MILLAASVFIVGALASAAAPAVEVLVIARIVIGSKSGSPSTTSKAGAGCWGSAACRRWRSASACCGCRRARAGW